MGNKEGWGAIIVRNVKEIADEYGPPRGMVLALLPCAALVGVIVLVGYCRNVHVSSHGVGKVVSAHLVPLAGSGNVMIVATSVTHTARAKSGTERTWETGRVDVIDLGDGHRRNREVLDAPPSGCLEAGPGLAWCALAGGPILELRDAATFARRANMDGLKRPVDARLTDQSSDSLIDRFAMGDSWYSFEGQPRSALTFHDSSQRDRDSGDVPVKTIAPETTLIAPKFVVSAEQAPGQPMVVGAERWMLVAHADNVDARSAGLLLSAVSVDGKQHWNAAFPGNQLVAAWLVGDRLVLAITRAIVVLDPADGHVVWRTDI